MNIDGIYTHRLFPSVTYKVTETDVVVEVEVKVEGRGEWSNSFPKDAYPTVVGLFRGRQTDENWKYAKNETARKWFY